jgi:hypothetical protein
MERVPSGNVPESPGDPRRKSGEFNNDVFRLSVIIHLRKRSAPVFRMIADSNHSPQKKCNWLFMRIFPLKNTHKKSVPEWEREI